MCMSIAFIISCMDNYDGECFGICGKTVGSAQRNVIRPFMKLRDMRRVYDMKYNIKESLFTVRGNYGGRIKENYFYVFGGKDEASYTTIQGITLAGVLLDEVVLMPKSFVNQAIARCSVEGAKLWFNCNPDKPTHWFKQEWIDALDMHNAKRIHFLLDDNPSLSENTKERYKRSFRGVFEQRYIFGEWVRAEGVIYSAFAESPESYMVDKKKKNLKDISFSNIGIDFGGNKSKTTFVNTGFHKNYEKVTVLGDYKIQGGKGEIDADRVCNEFGDFVQKQKTKFPWVRIRYVYGDSHDQYLVNSIANYIRRNKLGIVIGDAEKVSIRDRIVLTNTLLNTNRLQIHKDCKYIADGLKNAVWDEKRPDKRLDDFTSDIDIMDAYEYSIERFSSKLCPDMFGW